MVPWCSFATWQYLESRANISHFFGNGILPESVAVYIVYNLRLRSILWQTNSKHFVLLQITSSLLFLYMLNNAFTLLEGSIYPPVKSRLKLQVLPNSILSTFELMQRFQNRQLNLLSGSVFE